MFIIVVGTESSIENIGRFSHFSSVMQPTHSGGLICNISCFGSCMVCNMCCISIVVISWFCICLVWCLWWLLIFRLAVDLPSHNGFDILLDD